MLAELTDEQLAAMPDANLRPGELSRAFLARASIHQKEQEHTSLEADSLFFREHHLEDEHEREQEELHDRETALLQQIRARDEKLRQEAIELDKRTIRLADGRRVYVDADKFRDEQGRELEGADCAEAEQHHLEQHNAATWQEKQRIDESIAANAELRKKAEALQAGKGSPDADKNLSALERELQTRTAANLAMTPTVPDYGSSDYMVELGGLTSGFNQSATGTSPLTSAPSVTAMRSAQSPGLRKSL